MYSLLNLQGYLDYRCIPLSFSVFQPEFRPVKYFSIDRVFRNETLDATHLAEFHQIEGVVCDRGITLGDLIGLFSSFFRKLGKSCTDSHGFYCT